MKANRIHQWIAIGFAEVVLSLCLIAFAPRFLNSNRPAIGFLMWLAVPVMLGSSGLYVGVKWVNAQQARHRFVTRFPQHSSLAVTDFLDFSVAQVVETIEQFEVVQNDPEFQRLGISPLDLLRGANSK
ncbi:hypothetical protein H6G89_28090 [Oscillatoria sp. FACHB-1407]|uniref:hypothetical protein n=1 Tax=Oscillatoria sp. FACHB-1407 TaxID=2692847 RepID=UPI001682D350|nr:hypothetical protein [Oscillatoria sp. FACHB-1407]MBD2464868.1 hypothetical protein [Oscillatoria sp. FACHB-1407]